MRLVALLLPEAKVQKVIDGGKEWQSVASAELIAMVEGGTELGSQLFASCVQDVIEKRMADTMEQAIALHLLKFVPTGGVFTLDILDTVRANVLEKALQMEG